MDMTVEQAVKLIDKLGLLAREDIDLARAAPGINTADDFLAECERQSLLTSFQISKLKHGDTTGYRLGRFWLLYKINAGTFARVYRGEDARTYETVAVKVLRGRHTTDPNNIKQFQREAKLTEALRHPNIVRTLEVGCDKETSQHYIAMEFVQGGNLREFLKIRQKVSPAETVRLGIEMADGLAHALSKGVTHRDIKPTNILFTTEGGIKWVDFGLADLSETHQAGTMKVDAESARTVDYAGLEKATGVPKGDPRTDIYFLGSVLYEMVLGQPPMPQTKDRNARMMRTRFDAVQPLRTFPEVPRPVADVVDRMMAFQPGGRYQNYEELLRDLRGLQTRFAASSGVLRREPPRLLVVHSSERVQEVLKAKLIKFGYQPVMTNDLNRAVSLNGIKPADGIVVDLDVGAREAVWAVERLRRVANTDGRDFAAILLAGRPEHDDALDGLPLPRMAIVREHPATLGTLLKALYTLMPPPNVSVPPGTVYGGESGVGVGGPATAPAADPGTA